MSDGRRYAAPWCRSLVISSIGLTVLLVLMSGLCALQLPDTADDATTRALAIAAPLVMLVITALFMVRGYRLEPGTLVIERPLWKTRVPLAELRSAQADPHAMDSTARLFGNGGGFVFAGVMKNQRLGRYRCWVNDPALAVVLRFTGRVVVVSPAEPAAFIADIMATPRQPPRQP